MQMGNTTDEDMPSVLILLLTLLLYRSPPTLAPLLRLLLLLMLLLYRSHSTPVQIPLYSCSAAAVAFAADAPTHAASVQIGVLLLYRSHSTPAPLLRLLLLLMLL